MERRRIPHERARWLSAVLIVTAIVGAAAAVRRWPVSPLSPAPARLASRPLHLIVAPALASPPLIVLENSAETHAELPPVEGGVPELMIAQSPVPTPDVAAPSEDAPETPAADIPLVASRRLEIPLSLPAANFRVEMAAVAPDDPRAIIELPAVAVTRVVSVAGRGIKTGVRVTTAMLRAAF